MQLMSIPGVEIDLENFFDSLDSGVFLCQLARIIQSKAQTEVPANSARVSEDTSLASLKKMTSSSTKD